MAHQKGCVLRDSPHENGGKLWCYFRSYTDTVNFQVKLFVFDHQFQQLNQTVRLPILTIVPYLFTNDYFTVNAITVGQRWQICPQVVHWAQFCKFSLLSQFVYKYSGEGWHYLSSKRHLLLFAPHFSTYVGRCWTQQINKSDLCDGFLHFIYFQVHFLFIQKFSRMTHMFAQS